MHRAQYLGADSGRGSACYRRRESLAAPQHRPLPSRATWLVRPRELGSGSGLGDCPRGARLGSGRGARRHCGPLAQLLQHLKRIISDLCKLYNLPQHPDVEMLDQPLPAEQVSRQGP